MKCPACGNTLTALTLADVTVDVCKGGCGGIWFDRYELKRFDEAHESAGEILLDIERDPDVRVDHTLKRECPRCAGVVMIRHFYSFEHEIEVDECPNCAGYWLDTGELAAIRKRFRTETEWKKAGRDDFERIFAEELAQMQAEEKTKESKADRILSILRFICPSYYIPGKQPWGAY